MGVFTVLMPLWGKARREVAMGDRDAVLEAIRDGHYNLYRLRADSRDEVFEFLNIAHPEGWRDRSMCVGDVVIDPENNASLCRMVGWEDLPEALLLLPHPMPETRILSAGPIRL